MTDIDTTEPAETTETTEVMDGAVNNAAEADTAPENPSREAARWRTKFRDAETQLDALRTRVETMQRAEAERLAEKVLADPADMWRNGTQLADLLGEDGNLDAGKLTAAAEALAATRPHYRRTSPAAAPIAGVGAGKIPTGDDKPTFADAFKPKT